MKYQVLLLLVAILLPNIGMGKLTYSNEDIYYNEREGLNTGDSMATNEEQEIEYNAGDSEIQYGTKEPMSEEYTGLPQLMDSVQLASESFQCTCTGKGGKTLGKSCHDIKKKFPDSKSGFYALLINGRLVRKYCVGLMQVGLDLHLLMHRLKRNAPSSYSWSIPTKGSTVLENNQDTCLVPAFLFHRTGLNTVGYVGG